MNIRKKQGDSEKSFLGNFYFWFFLFLVFCFVFILTSNVGKVVYERGVEVKSLIKEKKTIDPVLDKEEYDAKMRFLAHLPEVLQAGDGLTGEENVDIDETGTTKEDVTLGAEQSLWPPVAPYPKAGAILPFKRVVAYYGNLYSRKMGILGEYEEEEVLSRLKKEIARWEEADPRTPVQPALHYVAMVAQADAGSDGMYRTLMPDAQIDKVLAMAEKIDAIVFLDIQVGLSNVQTELPKLEKYLKLPNVHFGIDPEFYMKQGGKPGKYIGGLGAEEINFAASYLAEIVNENNLPPKIFVIHRFTQNMVKNVEEITTLPEVQIVMHMDGWGGKDHKLKAYKDFVYAEPVQFAGFKIFYKNDVREEGSKIFTPEELVQITPAPIYIQYQ